MSTDTPRTDNEVEWLHNAAIEDDQRYVVSADFARQLERELAAAREALIKLRDCDWIITLPDRMDAVREIARSALNAIDAPPCWATGVCSGFDATDRTLTVQLSQPLTSTSNANPSGWKLGGNIQIRAVIDAERAKEGKP